MSWLCVYARFTGEHATGNKKGIWNHAKSPRNDGKATESTSYPKRKELVVRLG